MECDYLAAYESSEGRERERERNWFFNCFEEKQLTEQNAEEKKGKREREADFPTQKKKDSLAVDCGRRKRKGDILYTLHRATLILFQTNPMSIILANKQFCTLINSSVIWNLFFVSSSVQTFSGLIWNFHG